MFGEGKIMHHPENACARVPDAILEDGQRV